MTAPVLRFAPSPNGLLHLGHAYSALLNQEMAAAAGGRLLLRIEDIDLDRARPEFEAAIIRDLGWLGVGFERPVRRQSDHFGVYRQYLDRLIADDLVYPSFLTRGAIQALVADKASHGVHWPRDPDGAPLYPGNERAMAVSERQNRIGAGEAFAWRLDMAAARRRTGPLAWSEEGEGPSGETGEIVADPAVWGDVVVARSDVPARYHLAVVVDDALQQVTHIVRGRDLFHATSVHRLLQALFGFDAPRYRHHQLILGPDGRKLSKSRNDTALAALREAGETPASIRSLVGLPNVHD